MSTANAIFLNKQAEMQALKTEENIKKVLEMLRSGKTLNVALHLLPLIATELTSTEPLKITNTGKDKNPIQISL